MEIYLVGGAVRDELLGIPVHEQDWVVVGATPKELLKQGYRTVGNDFPVFLHPDTGEEYALARTERKSGHGYNGFTFYTSPDVSLEQDLIRRDLTINAIAKDNNGKLIDPYHGQDDLEKKLLRHISPAFSEDPLRVLRVARFAAKLNKHGFRIATETLSTMKQIGSCGELNHLTPERVWQEWDKALTTSNPAVFITSLISCDALAILSPELDQYIKNTSSSNQTPLNALDLSAELELSSPIRFASLLAPLGIAFQGDQTQNILKKICTQLKTPKTFQDTALIATILFPALENINTLTTKEFLELLEKTDFFRRTERFWDAVKACNCNLNNHQRITAILEEISRNLDTLNISELVNKGWKGKELGNAIHEERGRIIEKLLNRD